MLGWAVLILLSLRGAALPGLLVVVHTRPTKARLNALRGVLASIDASRQSLFALRIIVAVDSYRPLDRLPEEDDQALQGYPVLNHSLAEPDPCDPALFNSLRCLSPLSIHRNTNATSSEFLLSLWSPLSGEAAVFLNEAKQLSPLTFEYVRRVLSGLSHLPPDVLGKVFGVALHGRGPFSELTDRRTQAGHSSFVLAQEPDLFGAVLLAEPWLEFRRWFSEASRRLSDPLVPYAHTNRWDARLHWRKWLLRYLYESGGGLLFPPRSVLREGLGFVVGEHWDKLHHLVDRYKPTWRLVEIGRAESTLRQLENPILFRSVAVINANGETLSEVSSLKGEDANAFDKCTLVMTFHSRPRALRSRLLHFCDWSALDRVIVVWNLPDRQPPSIFKALFPVPIIVAPMSSNSLNNRFLISSFVNTSCVVFMDDDWHMPLDHLQYAFDVWRKQFFDYLVGFRHQGRAHIQKGDSHWYVSAKTRGVSMVLPSGLFMDRKYFAIYSSVPKYLLDFVDVRTNCEDILLNFVIANYTGKGPIVINRIASELKALGDKGLSSRKNHNRVRSECIQFFTKTFGRMPLLYFGWEYGVTRRQELLRSNGDFDVPHEREVWFSAESGSRCDPYRSSRGRCNGIMQRHSRHKDY